MKRIQNAVLILPLLLLLTACGFHARGSIDLPQALKKVYIFGASGKLKKEMTSMMKASNGQLVESPDEATIFIKIYQEKMDRRVLSLSERGKSSEFELLYRLKYQLFDAKDQPLQEEQDLEISRDFYNDQQYILAKSREEDVIHAEMYKQAVRSLIARARAITDDLKTGKSVKD